jgi:hypothetical protein
MLEVKSKTSEINEQNKQITCKIDDRENSSKTNLEKLMSKPTQFGLLVLIVLALIVVVIPQLMVNYTMSIYNDTTLANTHSTTSTNLLIATVTALYVWLTGNLVTISKKSIELSKESITKSEESIKLSKEAITQNKRSIELSEEAIKQSRKEQQIRDIEHRLEKFYIPADDIINLKHRNRNNTINGFKRNTDGQFVQGLQHLRKYSYLADKTTYESYDKYMSTGCTKLKSITCRDKYGEFHNCEHHEGNCHNQYELCQYNLEFCAHNPDREKSVNNKRKDNTRCTFDNSNCKYINDLKNAIIEDVQRYKEKLSELKE